MALDKESALDPCIPRIDNQAEAKSANTTSPPPRDIHGVAWFLVCAALYISCFLYGLDTTIAADIQSAIIVDFGDVDQLTWIGAGFPLGSVSVTLLVGFLYTIVDMKWLFIITLALFEIGSVLCGAAPNLKILIVGRVLAGCGGSGLYLGVLNYLSFCTSDNSRGVYLAGSGLIWCLGCILGPVIGGGFSSSSTGWVMSFYLNLVVAAVFLPVYLFYLPSITIDKSETLMKRLARIDFLGWLLWAGFVNALSIVLTFAGSLWAWNDSRTIATWIVFGVLLVAFILQQRYRTFVPAQPIYPAHLIKHYSRVLLYIGTSASVVNLFVPAYYIPLYFQFSRDDTAILAAVRLLPFISVLSVANVFAGYLLPKVGYYWTFYFIAGIFMIPGSAAMMMVDSSTPAAYIYGYTVLIGIGAGLTNQTGYSIATVLRSLEGHPEDSPNVVMFLNTSQIGTTLIALLISGQLFQTYSYRYLKAALAGQGFTDGQLRNTVIGTQSALFEQIGEDLRPKAIEAITMAMSKVYIVCTVAGVVTLIVGILLPKHRLSGLTASGGGG